MKSATAAASSPKHVSLASTEVFRRKVTERKIATKGKSPKIHLAIAGGHSSSVAFAFDLESGPLGVAKHEGINPHLYRNPNLRWQVGSLIDRLAVAMKLDSEELREKIGCVFMSCAGAASRTDQSELRDCLHDIFPCIRPTDMQIVDDTWAGLVAGTLSLSGTCAFAGTGASVFVGTGRNPSGWSGKIDGWGAIIGDFGSGFQLVVDTFRKICRHWNRCGEEPDLCRDLRSIINNGEIHLPPLENIESFQTWFDAITLFDFNKDWRIRYARLAEAVTKAADRTPHNKMAGQLVRSSADDIIESLDIAFARWPSARKRPVAFQGGMFEHSKHFRRRVYRKLASQVQAPVCLARYRVVLGAVLLALKERGLDFDKAGYKFIENCIDNLNKEERSLLIREDGAGIAHPRFV